MPTVLGEPSRPAKRDQRAVPRRPVTLWGDRSLNVAAPTARSNRRDGGVGNPFQPDSVGAFKDLPRSDEGENSRLEDGRIAAAGGNVAGSGGRWASVFHVKHHRSPDDVSCNRGSADRHVATGTAPHRRRDHNPHRREDQVATVATHTRSAHRARCLWPGWVAPPADKGVLVGNPGERPVTDPQSGIPA